MKLRRQLTCFSVNGLVSTLLHVAIATSAIHLAGFSSIAANLTAYSVATIFSYVANTVWSFSSSHSNSRFLRFVSVAVVGAFLTGLIAAISNDLGLSPYIGICIVILTVPGFTFVGHKYWTYRA